jgi:hypothetical protein
VYRAGQGFFRLDEEFTAPDDEVPSICVVPLDEAAQAAYEKKYGKKVSISEKPKAKAEGQPIEEVVDPNPRPSKPRRAADE